MPTIFSTNARYDKSLETVLGSIRLAHQLEPELPVVQLKLTALIPGKICVGRMQNNYLLLFSSSIGEFYDRLVLVEVYG